MGSADLTFRLHTWQLYILLLSSVSLTTKMNNDIKYIEISINSCILSVLMTPLLSVDEKKNGIFSYYYLRSKHYQCNFGFYGVPIRCSRLLYSFPRFALSVSQYGIPNTWEVYTVMLYNNEWCVWHPILTLYHMDMILPWEVKKYRNQYSCRYSSRNNPWKFNFFVHPNILAFDHVYFTVTMIINGLKLWFLI